jgi:hypothetical protein
MHCVREKNEPYWKVPESRCIMYSVLNNYAVKVEDIINLFSISWDYNKGYAYDVDIQQRIELKNPFGASYVILRNNF